MGIQQNHQLYSTWVTTLLSAVSKNFGVDKNFKCGYLEEGENYAKSVVAKLITDKFGEQVAVSEIAKLWPNTTYGILINNGSLKLPRTFVKIKLIENYFKFYSNDTVS